MPLSVMEAMHFGLPVVASDVGSVAEIVVSGETGLLFAPDDLEAFVAAIESLRTDPARLAAFGEAGRVRALRHFTAWAMSEAYLEVYEEARRSLTRRRWRGRPSRSR
jgi:glycosyltransferase involved in cell wall biosynthesis